MSSSPLWTTPLPSCLSLVPESASIGDANPWPFSPRVPAVVTAPTRRRVVPSPREPVALTLTCTTSSKCPPHGRLGAGRDRPVRDFVHSHDCCTLAVTTAVTTRSDELCASRSFERNSLVRPSKYRKVAGGFRGGVSIRHGGITKRETSWGSGEGAKTRKRS